MLGLLMNLLLGAKASLLIYISILYLVLITIKLVWINFRVKYTRPLMSSKLWGSHVGVPHFSICAGGWQNLISQKIWYLENCECIRRSWNFFISIGIQLVPVLILPVERNPSAWSTILLNTHSTFFFFFWDILLKIDRSQPNNKYLK